MNVNYKRRNRKIAVNLYNVHLGHSYFHFSGLNYSYNTSSRRSATLFRLYRSNLIPTVGESFFTLQILLSWPLKRDLGSC